MCGVFGVFAPGRSVAHLTYLGLYALQHRGQESAGMAVSDGEAVTVVKEMGLVSTVFDDRTLGALPGDLAIGSGGSDHESLYIKGSNIGWARLGLPVGGRVPGRGDQSLDRTG